MANLLVLLTVVAQLVVVCEAEEHTAAEWVFSGCCEPLGVEPSPGAVLAPGADPAGTTHGRCADACVDTLLLVAATTPAAPSTWNEAAATAPIGKTGAITQLVDCGGGPVAPSGPRWLPRVAGSSTVLLI